MVESDGLHVDVVDDEIIVSQPGTYYSVTYYKRENDHQLYAKKFPMQVDRRSLMSQAEFLAKAWRRANDKARELGWIV